MSLQHKIIIGVIAFLVVLIPVTSFAISYRFRTQTKAKADIKKTSSPLPIPSQNPISSLDALKNSLQEEIASESTELSDSEVLFGPTLKFTVELEGRPISKQKAKVFIGFSGEGSADYLLSFNVEVPDSGIYKNLSLAGLTSGDTYTATVKGPSQLATSSAFLLKPSETDLGTVKLKSGDLNDDNVINQADLSIGRQAAGSVPGSVNWNELVDFNMDGIVNGLDLAIILRNIGYSGSSGPYYSKPASGSANLKPIPTPLGKPDEKILRGITEGEILKVPSENGGFWLWVPE